MYPLFLTFPSDVQGRLALGRKGSDVKKVVGGKWIQIHAFWGGGAHHLFGPRGGCDSADAETNARLSDETPSWRLWEAFREMLMLSFSVKPIVAGVPRVG